MTHLERFGTQIDDYLEGSLGDAERREIETLLAGSPEARRELADYRRMVDGLAALPGAIEPERDLFPAIDERLDEAQPGTAHAEETRPAGARGRGGWPRPALLLAATLVAALALAYVAVRVVDPERGAPRAPGVPATAVDPAPVAGNTVTSRAETDLLAATERLRQALERNRAALPPETLRLVERNLEIIQAAIVEIQVALDRNPANPELHRALVAYYRHELALLERVNRAASRL